MSVNALYGIGGDLVIINDLRFVRTCYACPEQYDVFDGENQVGYVRLRHGWFSVSSPDLDTLYLEADVQADGDGIFEGQEARSKWLTMAAEVIAEMNTERGLY